MKKMLLFSAVLMSTLLFAAPGKVQINVWKSLLRYHNANLTLCFLYSGTSVGLERQDNRFGGFRLAATEWKGDEKMVTKVNEGGASLQVSWPGVAGAALQAEVADDNTIAFAFTKPESVTQKLFFHIDRAKLGNNGKCALLVDGKSVEGDFCRGGIKSITFFAGDAAKTFSFKFGTNCAVVVVVNDKSIDFNISTFKADAPAEFTLIPGEE